MKEILGIEMTGNSYIWHLPPPPKAPDMEMSCLGKVLNSFLPIHHHVGPTAGLLGSQGGMG